MTTWALRRRPELTTAVVRRRAGGGRAHSTPLSIMGPTTRRPVEGRQRRSSRTHRVPTVTQVSDTLDLRPLTVGGVNTVEVARTRHLRLVQRDWIGHWATSFGRRISTPTSKTRGCTPVRLEVFNAAGVKQTSATSTTSTGTVIPSAVLPRWWTRVTWSCLVDNRPATVGWQFPAVRQQLRVVPSRRHRFSTSRERDQETVRLHSWTLSYVKAPLASASGDARQRRSDTGAGRASGTGVSARR